MNKQPTALHGAMDNLHLETAENRWRFIRNSCTKNTEDLQSYDNKAMLETVSLTNKLLRNWEEKEEVDLEIHYARYGSTAQKRDVLDIIEQQVSPHQRLNILVNNDNLSGDFYPGEEKQLHIIYTFNGMLCEEKLSEGEVLSVPKLVTGMSKTNIIPILIVFFMGIIIGLFVRGYESGSDWVSRAKP